MKYSQWVIAVLVSCTWEGQCLKVNVTSQYNIILQQAQKHALFKAWLCTGQSQHGIYS